MMVFYFVITYNCIVFKSTFINVLILFLCSFQQFKLVHPKYYHDKEIRQAYT
jgi:hypothetical protein